MNDIFMQCLVTYRRILCVVKVVPAVFRGCRLSLAWLRSCLYVFKVKVDWLRVVSPQNKSTSVTHREFVVLTAKYLSNCSPCIANYQCVKSYVMLHRKLTLSVAMVKCLSFNMKTPNFLRELKYQLQNFCQSKLTIFGVFFQQIRKVGSGKTKRKQ